VRQLRDVQDVTDVDREARAAKKAAAKRAAASGWYRNLHGTMSFAGLAGLNVAVEGQQDGDADSAGVPVPCALYPVPRQAMHAVRVRRSSCGTLRLLRDWSSTA